MQIAFHTKNNLYKDDSYSLIVILKYNNLTFYINELGDNADAVLIASQDMGFRILILMLILRKYILDLEKMVNTSFAIKLKKIVHFIQYRVV